MPSRRSGWVTSTATLKLLFPASLPMLPPTASIVSAICSAVRVLVPFNSVFAISRVIPFVPRVSARSPPRNTAAIETNGNRGSSRTKSRRPLDSSIFWISPALIAGDFSFAAAAARFVFNDVTVRLSSTKYLRATRRISSEVIFWTVSR